MFKTLYMKMVFILVLLILSLVAVVGLFLTASVAEFYMNDFVRRMEDGFGAHEEMMQSLYRAAEEPSAADELREVLSAYSGALGIDYDSRHFYILNGENGEPLRRSGGAPNIDLAANIVTALGGGIGVRQTLAAPVFDCAVPLAEGQFIIYIRDDKAEMTALNRALFRIVLQAAALGVLISVILALILSKTMTIPIENLTQSAGRFAQGDFGQKLGVRSRDEIGTLTETFNNMAGALRNSMEAVAGERDKLSTIFLYMTDGIAAFSLEGGLLHVNPAACHLMDLSGPADFGYHLFEDALPLREAAGLHPPSCVEREIRVGEKDLRLFFAAYGIAEGDKGVIAVIHDNTEQMRLEKMRREFVSNVSHELRTPLTGIKSYAETLAEPDILDMEDISRFSQVIVGEADRMTRLVRDLLTLSRFDYGKMEWRRRSFKLTELLRHVYDLMRMAAKEKGHSLSYYEPENLPMLVGDRDRIEQILVNIIGNSISYTPEGGEIHIEAEALAAGVDIRVRDNGIGIPESDLPFVFDRFYRVDKARSRSMGGTGLGLAIAKEIAEGHGGQLRIDSKPGEGTCITLHLPLNAVAEPGGITP